MQVIKKLNFILIIICLFFLTSCKKEIPYKSFELIEKDNLKIVVTSDLHFLSKKMIEVGSSMLKENYYGDGRIICYNEELIDAFIYQMIIELPDVVIVTGDLTFDGSYQNHFELTKKFSKLVDKGIRVLITPGNHDLNSPSSRKYLSGGLEEAPYLTAEQYEEMYYNFGRGNAVSKDKNSYSYFYQLSNTLGVLMIDTNCYDLEGNTSLTLSSGKVKENTLKWIEKVLDEYQVLDVIVASHHNLYTHSTMFKSGYQIDNYYLLKDILIKHNIKLYLSGHMHIQHYNHEDGITEILTSALSITPHQYGLIDYYKEGEIIFDYSTKITDVSAYAKSINSTDEKLLNFAEYSKNFYQESSYKKAYGQVMFNNSSLYLQAEALGRLMSLLNIPYFEGNAYTVVEDIKETEDYKLIERFNMKSYIDSIIDGSKEDYRYIKIKK